MSYSKYKKYAAMFFLSASLAISAVPVADIAGTRIYAAEAEEEMGKIYKPLRVLAQVTAGTLIVRVGAGTAYKQLVEKETPYSLKNGKKVYIDATKNDKDGKRWYHVLFKTGGKWHKGYVSSEYITVLASTSDKVKGSLSRKAGVYARTKPVVSGSILKYNKKNVSVKYKQNVHILGEKTINGEKFFYIGFYFNKKYLKGYVKAEYVTFRLTEDYAAERAAAEQKKKEEEEKKNEEEQKETTEEKNDSENETKNNEGNKETQPATEQALVIPTDPVPVLVPETPAIVTPMTDEQFEASLTTEGFPEDYKPYLRTLHASHPMWIFKADRKGVDWETAVAAESKVGVNLISNVKNAAWKSTESGAYNWDTDKYVVYDAGGWVTASNEAVRYYMDPRNWLNEDGIYQFELLSYQSGYQTLNGVNSILLGSVMGSGASFTYTDLAGSPVSRTYADTFIEAAAYSGVSPYHLASRSKQEVVGGYGFSSSVSGSVKGYEGLYNFYNIGAYNSAESGGAIAHGLTFARNGEPGKLYSDGTDLNTKMMIPWDNQYKAIVGGAVYIGHNYIDRGQNTVYLQKFNLTSKSQFAHQYMSNIEVGKSESAKTRSAYSMLGEAPIVFSIPVYENMQKEVAAQPGSSDPLKKLSPNNYLADLSVEGYMLTPTFQPEVTDYTVVADPADVSVTIRASAVNSEATITGAGEVILEKGTTLIPVVVTAANGTTRVYNITFAK